MTETQIVFTEIFTVIPDSKTKIKSSSYLESGKYAVVDQGKELIAGYTDTSPTVVEKLLPVIVFGDHTRAVKYVDFPFTAGADGTQILKPSSLTNPKYGFYLVLHAVGQIPSKGYARHFGELKKMKFHLPSLEKQRKIVEKLDSAFAEIDLLESNLGLGEEKANQLLQSLLSSEFSFTSDENSNNPSAPQGNDIKLVPLKDFCKMYQPPTISTKEMIPDGKFIVFGANGPIGRYHKFNHEEPQLLVTCRGATCGAVNMSEQFAWINGNAMVIQPDLEVATLEYMKYAFLGGIDVSSSITGSAQPQITRTTLEVIKVPLPPLETQSEIVEKLYSTFAEIEALKAQIKMEKDYVVALRQSLLSNAFALEEAVA